MELLKMGSACEKVVPYIETESIKKSKHVLLTAKVTRHEVFVGRTLLGAKNKKKTLEKYVSEFAKDTKELTSKDMCRRSCGQRPSAP